MAARSTEHQDNQQLIISSEVDPSLHMIVSQIIKRQELPSHHQLLENEDGAADEEINLGIPMEVDLNHYRPLYVAALQGNWEDASKFFENDPNAFTAKISVFSMTALHAAAYNGQTEFVENMLLDERLPYEVLRMPDADGLTPLHYAAMSGSIGMAKALLTKDASLTQIADRNDYTPLLTACSVAPECKELVWYLVIKTKDDPPASPFTGKMAGQLISSLAHAGFYDIIQYLLGRYPNLITAVSSGNTLLRAMAEEPSNFESGHTFSIWERWIYQIVPEPEPIATESRPLKGDMEESSQNSRSYAKTPVWRRTYVLQALQWLKMSSWEVIENSVPFIRRIQNIKARHKLVMDWVVTVCEQVSKKSNKEMIQYFNDHDILVTAVINGVVEIVRVCLDYFPDLICLSFKDDDQTLLVHAVKHRQEKIFNLLYERTTLSKRQAYTDVKTYESVLIQAAKLSPQPRLTTVSGAALQMQREMQWFKAVESMLNPGFKTHKFGKKTAWQTFQEEHKNLFKEGQEWMKNTSNSCMLVAALIATVVFAATFTVPGGSNEGIPILLRKAPFLVFAVADALALFSSITSILMFLSALTSRYAEEDFLKSLPLKLVIGLFSLFLSLATMMLAFGATLYIMINGQKWDWVPVLIVLLSLFPVILFGTLQLRLFIQMFQSTFGKSIFRP